MKNLSMCNNSLNIFTKQLLFKGVFKSEEVFNLSINWDISFRSMQ